MLGEPAGEGGGLAGGGGGLEAGGGGLGEGAVGRRWWWRLVHAAGRADLGARPDRRAVHVDLAETWDVEAGHGMNGASCRGRGPGFATGLPPWARLNSTRRLAACPVASRLSASGTRSPKPRGRRRSRATPADQRGGVVGVGVDIAADRGGGSQGRGDLVEAAVLILERIAILGLVGAAVALARSRSSSGARGAGTAAGAAAARRGAAAGVTGAAGGEGAAAGAGLQASSAAKTTMRRIVPPYQVGWPRGRASSRGYAEVSPGRRGAWYGGGFACELFLLPQRGP